MRIKEGLGCACAEPAERIELGRRFEGHVRIEQVDHSKIALENRPGRTSPEEADRTVIEGQNCGRLTVDQVRTGRGDRHAPGHKLPGLPGLVLDDVDFPLGRSGWKSHGDVLTVDADVIVIGLGCIVGRNARLDGIREVP